MSKPANETPAVNHFKEIKARSNLIEFIHGETGTKPKRRGGNTFFNPCPFCDHKDCFSVFEKEAGEKFKCHSCGKNGDLFNFVEEYRHVSTAEALKIAAEAYNVDISRPQAADSKPRKDNQLQKTLDAAVKHYREALAARADVVEYLTSSKPDGRGHTPETINTMEIGFADGHLAEALQEKGFSLEHIKATGLYVEVKDKDSGKPTGKWKDFFCPGVLVFPHRTETGEIGHFTIKDPRKKIDYQLRSENRLNGLLFGNQKAIAGNTLICVEGENDLGSFFDAGARNVLATLGPVTEQHLQWLHARCNRKRLVLWFDYDIKYGANGQPPAGINYTRKIYRHLLQNDACQVVVASAYMEPGEDPDDWIQKDMDSAGQRIRSIVKKAVHPLLWELRIIPNDVKQDAGAVLQWLQDLEYFDMLGSVPELQRDAVIIELQKLGFSRESVLNNITDSYGLREILEEYADSYDTSAKKQEYYMIGYANRVWNYFRDRGKFFVSDDDALHLFYHHKIYKIGDNIRWQALLHREARLNFTTPLAKYVNYEIRSLCMNKGAQMNAFSWIHPIISEDEMLLYLNLKDPMNRICRISQGEVEMVENGTNEHSVLLAESHQMRPFTFDPDVRVETGMDLLHKLLFDALACDDAQKYLVLAWALSSFLIPLSQTKALMKMEGGSGSGKTTAAKFLSLLIYGESMVGRSTTASDYSMGSTEPLIIKDNLETDDINKNALNFLLLAATGAQNLKRSSGTESGVTSETLNCMVAITAIEPFFKPELINRTYIVDFARKHQSPTFIETDNVMKLTGSRDVILSAWLTLLAEDVMPRLDERREIMDYIRKQHGEFSKDRTIEFISILGVIAGALLKYIPLPASMRDEAGNRAPEYVLLDAWIKYQDEQARQTEMGTNVVLQLLEGIRREYLKAFVKCTDPDTEEVTVESIGDVKVRRIQSKTHSIDPPENFRYVFTASTLDLLAMMQRYGREHGTKVPFSNAKQLGVRIANEKKTLEDAGWNITRDRIVRGTRYANFEWSNY